jgi:chromate transporter
VRPFAWGPFSFDAPVWGSVNLWALLLSAAAIVAMFRFKIGMLQTLAATSAAGVALYMAGAIA